MADSDLAFLSALELSAQFKAKKLSPVEVTDAMLKRIERLDGKLVAYCAMMADTARAEAKAAEAEIAKGQHKGPLHGVPIGIKDLCAAKGVVTAAGMPRIHGRNVTQKDSTVVARLRAAGAVILGKLQLTEGAVAHHHPDIKPPVNPWHANYWSGASSSGSGVATAAGLCYGSLGSDTGGSIRFPCFSNGVTGIKPTWGRVSRAGVFALSQSLDHIGPMTRSAADAGAMLGAIAGADPEDPTALKAPVPDYLAGLGQGLKGVRVGYDEAWCHGPCHPAISKAVEDGIAILKAAGAEIKPIIFPAYEAVLAAWFPICTTEAAAVHEAYYPARAADYGDGIKGLLDDGRAATGIAYAKAQFARQDFRGALEAVFQSVDVIAGPSYMRLNMSLPEFERFGSQPEDWPNLLRYTAPFDMTGSPTICLPAGFDKNGLPIGFQLIGRHLDEALLVRAGDAYQRATDWHKRRPPMAS